MASYKVQFSEWMSEGFDFFVGKVGVWLIASLLFGFCLFIPALVFIIPIVFIAFKMESFTRSGVLDNIQSLADLPPEILPLVGLSIAGILLMILLSIFLIAGLYRMGAKQARGEEISVGMLFSGAKYTGSFLLFFLMTGLLAIPLTLACIIPVLVLYPIAFFGPFLIVDQNMGAVDALKASYNKAKEQFWALLLFAFVTYIIAGLIWPLTMPLQFTFGAIAYREAFGLPTAKYGEKTPESPTTPNYPSSEPPAPDAA